MYSYVAFIWNRQKLDTAATVAHLSALLSRARSDLEPTLELDGMIVFSARPREESLRTYVLPRDSGIVLGRLFPMTGSDDGSPPDVRIDEKAAVDFIKSRGQRLVDEYWGSYIAFLRSTESDECWIIRDCSGWLPCYRITHMEVVMVFSDLADLGCLHLPPFTLNHGYLAAFILNSQLQIRECGLSEVTEILAGECLEIRQSSVTQFPIWDPRRIVLRHSIEDYSEAETQLKNVTQKCIGSWAGVYDSVLLSLSGGLDSAIVLGCLQRAPTVPTITCLNQCTESTADDERSYARLAASRAQVPLIESAWSKLTLSDRVFSVPKTPKPAATELDWWLELEYRNDVAMRAGADAIWTGQGGDHLFWAPRGIPIAADYISRHGVGLQFLRVVGDAARLAGKSYFSVIRTALKLGRSCKPWLPDEIRNLQPHFLNLDALPSDCQEYTANPWTTGSAANLPKAKQAQILFLADVLNRHRHVPRAEFAYQRHPLLSQPLIELCLQIPIYLLVRGGHRRAMARRAFKDRVPQAIIEREDKGDTTARVRAMIRQNEAFIREILLDGILVREGIVSRRKLEPILVDGQSYRDEDSWPLRACIAGEIWARSWIRTTALRVAA